MEFEGLLGVAVSVGAVLVLFSVAASAVHEYIADSWLNLRGKTLAQAVGKILEQGAAGERGGAGASLFARAWSAAGRAVMVFRWVFGGHLPALYRGTPVETFYETDEIGVLMNGRRLPSAIEAERFARAALAVLRDRQELSGALAARLEVAAARLGGDLRAAARAAGFEGAGDWLAAELAKGPGAVAEAGDTAVAAVDAALADLEREYGEVMDRASGWYLRNTKLVLFLIGLGLAVGSNVDLLRYADRLMTAGDLAGRVETLSEIVGDEGWEALIAAHEASGPDAAAGDGAAVAEPAALAPEPAVDAGKAEDIVARTEALTREADLILGHLGTLEVQVGWDCMDVPRDRGVLWLSAEYCAWRTGIDAADEAGLPAPRLAASERLGLPVPTASQAIGWVLIAFGVTFGARMWFDLVKRLINLRTAGLTGRIGAG